MHRGRRWLLLSMLAGAGCTPPAESEPAPQPFQGGTLAHGYGVTLKKVAYVPNDRRQSFGLVETCEGVDGSSCGNRAWAPGEIDSVSKTTALLERLSGFQLRVDMKDPEVRIHARADAEPGAGCADGSVTCWFGSTSCSEGGGLLLDASGAPVLDSYSSSTWSFTACSRWALELSLVNIYTWADFLGLEREHVLRSVMLHEMGHTLGLEHARLGIMRPHLPVCYFIDPGDARDVFDPTSTESSFQRFECLEGVHEPELSPVQRAKLDAYRGGELGWSMVSPG